MSNPARTAPYLTDGTYDEGGEFLGVVDSTPLAFAEFDARGLQAGGYTWIAILHSLAKIESIAGEFEIGGEGDNAYINAHDPAILDAFGRAIQRAMTDLDYLRDALDRADPDLLE